MINGEWATILPPPKNNRVLSHHIISYQLFSYPLLISYSKFTPFASTAGGLRNCNAATFAPF